MMSTQFHAPPFRLFTYIDLLIILPQYTLSTVYTAFIRTLVNICKLLIVVEGMKLSTVHEKVVLAGSEVPYLRFLLIFFFCISK